MIKQPHLAKLKAAIKNEKCAADAPLLQEALELYQSWVDELNGLTTRGHDRVAEMVDLLNRYKDTLEVEMIMQRGSQFLYRQKGQLKLDNSILEEFLIQLVRPEVIEGIEMSGLKVGLETAFMSLSFRPHGFGNTDEVPMVVVKTKDQDFIVGAELHFQFSRSREFPLRQTKTGTIAIAAVAAETKVNLDKTMFQEAAGTALRLKQGLPDAKYFLLAEYLDMEPEDCRLTAIDNVYLLRHAKRLPANLRRNVEAVWRQRKEHPIDPDVVWRVVQELQTVAEAAKYDPRDAVSRGSFV